MPTPNACVLIVDDDEDDRMQLGAALEGQGHALLYAASGREALDLFMARPIHVVVTDIVMEDGDGIDLIASLKAVKPDAAVVAVSGKGAAGLSVAGAIGADVILTKPVTADALRRAVTSALDRS